MCGIGIDHLREEAEDKDNNTITDTKSVEEDAADTRDVKRAPDEFVCMPRGTGHLTWMTNRASDAMPEKESFGNDVGSVEAADANRDDIVESGCGADVDQANGTRNRGHDNY